MEAPSTYDKAKERVEEKLGFYSHLGAYVVVNLFLIILNLMLDRSNLWFYWPLAGWGVGLFFHGMGIFIWGEGSSVKERMIKEEMERREGVKE